MLLQAHIAVSGCCRWLQQGVQVQTKSAALQVKSEKFWRTSLLQGAAAGCNSGGTCGPRVLLRKSKLHFL